MSATTNVEASLLVLRQGAKTTDLWAVTNKSTYHVTELASQVSMQLQGWHEKGGKSPLFKATKAADLNFATDAPTSDTNALVYFAAGLKVISFEAANTIKAVADMRDTAVSLWVEGKDDITDDATAKAFAALGSQVNLSSETGDLQKKLASVAVTGLNKQKKASSTSSETKEKKDDSSKVNVEELEKALKEQENKITELKQRLELTEKAGEALEKSKAEVSALTEQLEEAEAARDKAESALTKATKEFGERDKASAESLKTANKTIEGLNTDLAEARKAKENLELQLKKAAEKDKSSSSESNEFSSDDSIEMVEASELDKANEIIERLEKQLQELQSKDQKDTSSSSSNVEMVAKSQYDQTVNNLQQQIQNLQQQLQQQSSITSTPSNVSSTSTPTHPTTPKKVNSTAIGSFFRALAGTVIVITGVSIAAVVVRKYGDQIRSWKNNFMS